MVAKVVDSNVWVIMDDLQEKACALVCVEWGSSFSNGEDKLAVDRSWKIISEYRENIQKGGLAERYLNEFFSQPWERIEFVDIELDRDGIALLPDSNLISDPSDRKFVAVALRFEPPALIINATDTDWAKDHDKLATAGITVQELCPAYIQEKLKE
ncbi:MAG: hypothetical protein CL610_13445 [Anaerolineaceae bacterium]|nr:hypothetical protein [Anaerolineaceae bacterium]